jgi:hypothetical protein
MKSQGVTTLVKNRPAEPGFFSPFLHRFYSLSILIRLALSPLKPALDSSHIFPDFAIVHFCIFFRPGISPFLSAGPSASLFSLRDIHWIWRDIYLGQMWIPPQSYDAI